MYIESTNVYRINKCIYKVNDILKLFKLVRL